MFEVRIVRTGEFSLDVFSFENTKQFCFVVRISTCLYANVCFGASSVTSGWFYVGVVIYENSYLNIKTLDDTTGGLSYPKPWFSNCLQNNVVLIFFLQKMENVQINENEFE